MGTPIPLRTEFIRLGALLKLAGVAGTGGEAKLMIQDGLVHVNGAAELRRGAKIRPGDVVSIELEPPVELQVEAEA